MRVWNIFLLVGVSFMSGSLVTYVLTVEYPQLRGQPARIAAAPPAKKPVEARSQMPLLPPTLPGTVMEVDPYARTPRIQQAEEAAMPRQEEAAEIIDLLRSEFMDAPALISAQLSEQTLGTVFQKLGDKVKIGDASVLGTDPKAKSIVQVLPSTDASPILTLSPSF